MLLFHLLIILVISHKSINGYRIFSQKSSNHHNIRHKYSILASSVDDKTTEKSTNKNFFEKLGSASIASAAVMAATSVNAAVGMKQLSAPDGERTFVYMDGASENRTGVIDSAGLPLVYDKTLIEAYWRKQSGALSKRWTEFLQLSVPFLTKIVSILVSGGLEDLKSNSAPLAKDARIIIEKLGPTFIKLGQMLSVRPDVLPPEALIELQVLQDSVQPFDTLTAVAQIESELQSPLGAFFSEISNEPVAAASLAQVYKARLLSGEFVAVKVQRPQILETVSKDLYVLRRAAEVYQGLVKRFAPQQRTDFVALLNEWAVGFYTELDFLNEAANQVRLKDLLTAENVTGIYIPKVYSGMCTRRILVTEWLDGTKLSNNPPEVIKTLIPDAQEAFLTQLLQLGFVHADPHPGNFIVLNEPRNLAKLALIDFGLVASLKQADIDKMVSAIIHLANRDYEALVDDFIQLEILPIDCDSAKVVPLMDKALTPYVKGGGAKKYEEELKKTYGMQDGSMTSAARGFQAMTQDALTVLNDIPFSIPPYFALLARAIVTLEGIALTGDPNYGIITEAYPFVARKLLREDRPEIQKALYDVLFVKGTSGQMKINRLAVFLNSALGVVARSSDAFIDLDTLPEETVSLNTTLSFVLSDRAASLRPLLVDEAASAIDLLLRQALRKTYTQFIGPLARSQSFLSSFLPTGSLQPVEEATAPFLLPSLSFAETVAASPSALISSIRVVPTSLKRLVDISAPKLNREEEIYFQSIRELITQTLGSDASVVASGDIIANPTAAARFILTVLSSLSVAGPLKFLEPVSDLFFGFLNLLPARERTTSTTISSTTSTTSSTDISSGSAEDVEVTKVLAMMGNFSASETAILRSTSSEILNKVSIRVLDRLLLLNQPAV